jgi:hypothetical protein
MRSVPAGAGGDKGHLASSRAMRLWHTYVHAVTSLRPLMLGQRKYVGNCATVTHRLSFCVQLRASPNVSPLLYSHLRSLSAPNPPCI